MFFFFNSKNKKNDEKEKKKKNHVPISLKMKTSISQKYWKKYGLAHGYEFNSLELISFSTGLTRRIRVHTTNQKPV